MFVGVDGCRAGWFSIELSAQNDTWETNIHHNIDELWERHNQASLILIDIPIGLREEGTVERLCDMVARQALRQPRGTSVFPVPCRQAVGQNTYPEANNVNKQITGRGLSVPAWGIVPKIREVDLFLLNHPLARRKIREVHPEICFWAFNKEVSMQHAKRKPMGYNERITLLQDIFPQTANIVNNVLQKFCRSKVAKDDILDALVAAMTAKLGGQPQQLHSIPTEPQRDPKDLRMEMVYCRR